MAVLAEVKYILLVVYLILAWCQTNWKHDSELTINSPCIRRCSRWCRKPCWWFNWRFVYDYVEVKIDEQTLTEIANKTGGKYFRATNNESLEGIYNTNTNIYLCILYHGIPQHDSKF